MAKLSEIFARTDSKSRILLVIGTVVAIIAIVVLGSKYLGGTKATGNARVAGAPSLQSVPGGQLTPEYYRALMQANAQTAQQAQVSGASAVPTLVNAPSAPAAPVASEGGCTIMCPSGDEADVTNNINNLVKEGKLSQADANQLLALAKNDVPVSQYSNDLENLVKQGKLTPDQARKLLADYQKQHANTSVAEGARTMDNLIKSGALPLDSANDLLALQKQNVTPAEYSAELNRLVAAGKISPATAALLLAQYTQHQAHQATEASADELKRMATGGQIAPDVATDLVALQKRNVPVDDYASELNRLVQQGKMTPATAAKLLEQYKAERTGLGAASTVNGILASAAATTTADIADLVKSGKLSTQAAQTLTDLQNSQASPEEYDAQIDALVKSGKLTPEAALKLKADYRKLAALRGESAKLLSLQGNNVSAATYGAELQNAVNAGILTPAQANELMQEYQAVIAPAVVPPPIGPGAGINPAVANTPGAENFAVLQRRLAQQQSGGVPAPAAPTTFTIGAGTPAPDQSGKNAAQEAAAEAQARAEAEKQKQQHIQDLMNAMSGQAGSLVAAWNPPVMVHKGGQAENLTKAGSVATNLANGGSGTKTTTTTRTDQAAEGPPLLKAGTILFAVLTTAVDSDYPDTPVMATIVSGQFKGAKLLGKLSLTQGQDKVSLSFTIMNRDDWTRTKKITAFAIDPDTARTVMASSVDHHYMLRYGNLFASSFVTGYANGISQSGSTTTSGIFGTSSTHPTLSPGEKIAVALGQVGTTFGTALASYVNTPNTVKVNSGVGLGILFMEDVT